MTEFPQAIRLPSPGSIVAVLLSCLFVFASFTIDAVGFRLPNQDPVAIARGNAFVATADNPSAIYYNPAGITQLKERSLRAGVYLVSGNTEYRPDTGTTTATNGDFQAVPQLYYVHPMSDTSLSFGIGIYSPYGLAIDWDGDSTFRTIAQEGEIRYVSLNPVIACKLNENLAVGLGATLNYSDTYLLQGVGFVENDQIRIEGDGFDIGFNAGFLLQPFSTLSFGVNYRSPTSINYDGDVWTTPPSPSPPYFSRTRTSAKIKFPQFVVAGVSWRPTDEWNLEVNIDWTDWDSVNDIGFEGLDIPPLTLNYRSSFMYEFGVTRKLSEHFSISFGFFFSENSSPDANFNPIVPDSDLYLGSIGFNHSSTKLDWAFAYHFGYNAGREVDGSSNNSIISETADGRYETLNHAFNFAFTYKF